MLPIRYPNGRQATTTQTDAVIVFLPWAQGVGGSNPPAPTILPLAQLSMAGFREPNNLGCGQRAAELAKCSPGRQFPIAVSEEPENWRPSRRFWGVTQQIAARSRTML